MNIHSQKFRRLLRIVLSILQAIIDIAVCFACLRIGRVTVPEAEIFVAGTMFIFFLFSPLYGFKNWTFWDETKSCLRAVLYSLVVSLLFAYSAGYSAANISVGLAAFFPAVMAARYLFRRILAALGILNVNVLIFGAGSAGKIFAKNINASPFTLRKICGFIDDDPDNTEGGEVLGKAKDFRRLQDSMNIDEVVIAEPEAPRKTIITLMHRFELYVRGVYILNTYSDQVRGIDDLHLTSASGGLLNPVNRTMKTLMDYVGGVMIVLLSAPLMLAIAWKISHDDGGNALFKHLRAGRNLKPFKVFKFRTMVFNSEKILEEMLKDDKLRREFKASFKFKNDPRVTPFGKVLRHTSLDELPQIFNVLKGQMSLVGPRPIVREEVDKYYGYVVARHIFHAKPGMTGLWQVSGRNDIEDYDLRIKYDMYYVHNWSLLLDIMILFRTIWVVLSGKGAY